jgi:hypothetical protein
MHVHMYTSLLFFWYSITLTKKLGEIPDAFSLQKHEKILELIKKLILIEEKSCKGLFRK